MLEIKQDFPYFILHWSENDKSWSETKICCELSKKKPKVSRNFAWATEKESKRIPFPFIRFEANMFVCENGSS